MARRGFGGMTALRAALGAAVGVGEGLQQREVLAAQREKERLATERQRRLDEAALRAEERQAVDAGMISASRIPTLTMPGATPLQDMEPTLRQNIGGKEYVYIPRVAEAERHRRDAMKAALERTPSQPRLEFRDGQRIDLTAGKATPIEGYKAPAKESKSDKPKGPSMEELLRAEAQWNSLTRIPIDQLTPEEGQFAKTMTQTFDRLRGRKENKNAPALDLIFQAVSAAQAQEQMRRQNRVKPAGGEDANEAAIAEEAKRRLAGQGGKPATPAAKPVAPTTPAKQTPAPTAAKPVSVEDAAAKRASRAQRWDEIKAQNPTLSDDEITARVMREIP